MAEIPEFEVPAFLKNQSTDQIHETMLDMIPDTLDKSEGGFVWDFTRPVALEKAKFVQFNLIELMKNIFPMWAYDMILDYHAFTRNINRKTAESATVDLTITGTPGTEIKAGYGASTEATDDMPSVEFVTTEDVVIDDSGTVVVHAKAVTPGRSGNVAANTIKLQTKPRKEITAVINEEPSAGGVDEEDNESLRQRIVDYDRSLGVSFVGSDSDYKRWAEEVPGVGSATVIPAQDDTGLVTIIVVDPDGNPATQDVCEKVEQHILRPDDRQQRPAPINAKLLVKPPDTLNVVISATVIIQTEYTLDGVKASFMKRIVPYLMRCPDDGVVRYTEIGKLLLGEGIVDYSDLLVNNGTANLPLGSGVLPVTDTTKVILNLDTSRVVTPTV